MYLGAGGRHGGGAAGGGQHVCESGACGQVRLVQEGGSWVTRLRAGQGWTGAFSEMPHMGGMHAGDRLGQSHLRCLQDSQVEMEMGREQSALVRSPRGLDGRAAQLCQFISRGWVGSGTAGSVGLGGGTWALGWLQSWRGGQGRLVPVRTPPPSRALLTPRLPGVRGTFIN